MITSINRKEKILEFLRGQGSASIQELVDAFHVSNMTIHRELNKLAATGMIQKKHGGVSLLNKPLTMNEFSCAMCNKSISERTVFIIKHENGDLVRSCCAHCGLMIQNKARKTLQSFTADFLHGHMVSANQAIYIIGSELKVCCVPSVLSFGSKQEAERFKAGFGGKLVNMSETVRYLNGMMHAQQYPA